METDYFPRGGQKIAPVQGRQRQQKRQHEENLFSFGKPLKSKKQRKEKHIENEATVTEDAWQNSLKLEGTLTYNKVKDGMIVLGCIRHISTLALQMELPGLIYGQVVISSISDAFTKYLTEMLQQSKSEDPTTTLKTMFELGQLVPVKIISVETSEKGNDIKVSLNPKDINAERIHSSFQKGALVWGNVLSELDHGYEISFGVKNCRVFLPFKNVDEGRKYLVGQPLYCAVHKIESSSAATTITVSSKNEHVDKIQLKEINGLDTLLPGTKVDFLVEDTLPHGIKGKVFNTHLSYLDKTHIFNLKLDRVRLGATLKALVLFIEPITKVIYVSLHRLEPLPGPKSEIGRNRTAEIVQSMSRGLQIKLSKEDSGFVTNKRLLNCLPPNAEVDLANAIRRKFPIGSSHTCRILDYNRLEKLYVCTFEPKVVKEKIFSVKDLTLGQLLKVQIDKILPAGMVVSIGHVKGFVPNFHLSSAKYTETLKSKYEPGMTVNARVLNLTEENNVVFTLKQALVDSDKCLTKLEDATRGSQFVGFVVQTKTSGVLVAFYGNVTGWISNKELNSENVGSYNDPKEYFFRGQIVNVWSLGFKNDKLQLSLSPPLEIGAPKISKIKVGQLLRGKITSISHNGIDVKVGKYKEDATIPLLHLSSNKSLCPTFLKKFKIGNDIPNLMCVKNTDIPILSRREPLARGPNGHISLFEKLKKGNLLRCSYENDSEHGIYVSTPIKDFQENILIASENIGEPRPVFKKYQCVLTTILDVNHEKKSITLGCRPDQLFARNLEILVNELSQNLSDTDELVQFCQKKKWKLTQYNLGQRVQCTVKTISEAFAEVSLPNEAKGVAASHLCPNNIKAGSTVEGVVLGYDFPKDRILVCLKNDVNQKIGRIQDGEVKKLNSCFAEILLFLEEYAIGILKDGSSNKQLVYCPLSSTDHRFAKAAYEGKKMKVAVQKKVGTKLVGVPKKVIAMLEKQKKEKKRFRKSEKMEVDSDESEVEIDEIVEGVKEGFVENGSEQNITDSEKEDEVEEGEEEGEVVVVAEKEEKYEVASDSDEEQIVSEVDQDIQSETDEDNDVSEEEQDIKSESDEDDDVSEKEQDIKSESDTSESGEDNPKKAPVSSVLSSFWTADEEVKEESSSSDEEMEDGQSGRKIKKLTRSERAKLKREEDEKNLQIENSIANTSVTPKTAEEFDRLLQDNPNSSKLWLNYMAMYIGKSDTSKARAIAKKALDTIHMTECKEKFNVWIGLINLENMYGTQDSFEEVFNNAINYNDSLEIYLNVIKMLASSGKLSEMEEKIKRVRAKEKQNMKMWLEIGQVYFSLGKYKEARNLKEAALKSISDSKRQFDLIVRFGIMEFQSGEVEQAIANFETILNVYPNKVNIWSIYVDQLVKKNKIDLARNVLEKASMQSLNVKAMKTILQKFISFEEKHGTPEAVEMIKERAKKYVRSAAGH